MLAQEVLKDNVSISRGRGRRPNKIVENKQITTRGKGRGIKPETRVTEQIIQKSISPTIGETKTSTIITEQIRTTRSVNSTKIPMGTNVSTKVIEQLETPKLKQKPVGKGKNKNTSNEKLEELHIDPLVILNSISKSLIDKVKIWVIVNKSNGYQLLMAFNDKNNALQWILDVFVQEYNLKLNLYNEEDLVKISQYMEDIGLGICECFI